MKYEAGILFLCVKKTIEIKIEEKNIKNIYFSVSIINFFFFTLVLKSVSYNYSFSFTYDRDFFILLFVIKVSKIILSTKSTSGRTVCH